MNGESLKRDQTDKGDRERTGDLEEGQFKAKALAGINWSVLSQMGRQALSFVIGVVLARLLSPREFGLLAMVTVIAGFALSFMELGFGAALVQRQNAREEHLSSVFWVNVISGLTMTLLFAAAAPLVARFYGEPLLLPLTLVLAANFVIYAFSIVQRVLMVKALDFRSLAVVEIGSVIVAGAVGIAMAVAGLGVWSLAANYLLATVVATALFWALGRWRPEASFEWGAVKELLGFSGHYLGTKTLGYWTRNVDNLLIGRFIGSSALGLYSKAYAVLMLPLLNVSRTVERVMFPSLSIIQDDRPRVKRVFLRMARGVAFITFPIFTGMAVVAEPFVLSLFGAQWVGMIPLVQVLCVLGVAQSVVRLDGNLYLSQGRADLQFRVNLLVQGTIIAGIAIGLQGGVMGVAVGLTVASLATSYVRLHYAGRLVGLSVGELLRALGGTLASAVAMALLVFGLDALLPAAWPAVARLAAEVALGVAVYAGLAHAFDVGAYRELREILARQWKKRAPGVEV